MKFKVGDKVHVNYPEYFMPTEIYTIKEIGTQFNEKSIQFEGTKYVASECQLTLVEEETKSKDIKWLTKEVDYQRDYTFEKFMEADSDSSVEFLYNGQLSAFRHVAGLLNQLDEQEITEEQALRKVAEKYPLTPNDIPWILDRYVANNLVEQPEIPQFVFDFIKRQKDKNKSLLQALYRPDLSSEHNKPVREWLGHSDELAGDHLNQELFARAWLAYPEVEIEQEPKYVIQITDQDYMVQDDDGVMYPTDLNIHKYKSEFTEQEIKDYDERYWEFRKPVEDLSE